MTRMLKRLVRAMRSYLTCPEFTTRRLLNRGLLELHEQLKVTTMRAYPDTLIIETINSCDGTCRLCPVGERRRARPGRILDMQIYRRFIDEVGSYARQVHFHNWGEPTLDPFLPERIRYAHDKGLRTFV